MWAFVYEQRRRRLHRPQLPRRDGPGDCFEAGTAPWPQSIEDMNRIAHQRVAWMRKTHPHAACGGRLLVAEVRRDSVDVSAHVSAQGALG